MVVANLKGGTGKTTTAVFVAHALNERGKRVLLVDADPQRSASRWNDYAGGFPVAVVSMASKTLHRHLPEVAGDGYDIAVVDTPPLEEQRGVVLSALRVAHDVLVPVAPTPIEIERLPALRAAVDDVADLRADGRSPRLAVLLVRTVSGAASTAVWRDELVAAGNRVLKVHVARREAFAQAYGQAVTRAADTAYGDAITELLRGV